MQNYEIQLPERGYQRTPPYTGYIDQEQLKLPGYGERRKPFEREEPTTYRFPKTNSFPGGINELEMLLSGYYDPETGIRGRGNTFYVPLIKDDDMNIGITHHPEGLGKLKVDIGKVEYGVPIADLNLPMESWRIQRH